MKKISLILFIFLLSVSVGGFAQTTSQNTVAAPTTAAPATDFFAGKWEITVVGTPNGDAKLGTELIRKDGKLTGELKDLTGKQTAAIPITKIEEAGDKLTIYFVAQGMDIDVALTKVDDDHLKGSLMSMFDSTALRVKN